MSASKYDYGPHSAQARCLLGDIQCQHLSIERGTHFDGRSICSAQTNVQKVPQKLHERLRKESELKATREPAEASVA
jgi:cytoskeletal protein CcmA (bactofilin family)